MTSSTNSDGLDAAIESSRDLLLKYTPTWWLRQARPEIQFKGGYEYQYEPYNDFSPEQVSMKGTQIGETERFLNRLLHFMDQLGYHILFIMPNDKVTADFSNARVKPAIEGNKRLRDRFTDVNNVGLRMMGDQAFYLRGSNTGAGLTSVPVDVVFIDELDECDQRNLGKAEDRTSGKRDSYMFKAGNPTLPNVGIAREFAFSDQKKYRLECPNCHEWLPLTWKSIAWDGRDPMTAGWQCSGCGMPWTNEERIALQAKGRWVAENAKGLARGYHFPRLLSPVKTPAYHAGVFLKDQARGETGMLHFHSSVLGEPYAAEGSRFTDNFFDDAVILGGHRAMADKGSLCAMGVDVGAVHHVAIAEMEPDGKRRYVKFCTVPRIDDLAPLVEQYNVRALGIDWGPYTEQCRDFQRKINVRRRKCVWLVRYRDIKAPAAWSETQGFPLLEVPRTESIDHVLAAFKNQQIVLPVDMPDEVRLHLRSVVRKNEEDGRSGNLVGRWVETEGQPDHYLHAINYCEAVAPSVRARSRPLRVYFR